MYGSLNGNVRRARYMANLSKERWDAAIREHEEILAALGSRDIKRIKALLSDHLAHKLDSVLASLPVMNSKAA
jgi:DNA-binding GntR family transcriptional regulator